MGRVWTLDTETKGTGAHVAPLERARGAAAPERELSLVTLQRPLRAAAPAAEAQPQRFKLVDVRAARLLGEDLELRAAIELLEDFESFLDVRVYTWMPDVRRWRLLTLDEHKALWAFRGREREADALTAR